MPSQTESREYQPQGIDLPPLYAWPPRPLLALRFLLIEILYPWGFIYLALAFPTWWYLTPDLETMATFEPGWIALLWLRNCAPVEPVLIALAAMPVKLPVQTAGEQA